MRLHAGIAPLGREEDRPGMGHLPRSSPTTIRRRLAGLVIALKAAIEELGKQGQIAIGSGESDDAFA